MVYKWRSGCGQLPSEEGLMPPYFLLLVLVSLLLLSACLPATTPDNLTPVTSLISASPTKISVTPVAATATPPLAPPAKQMANADVEYVRAVQASDGTWIFYVTVRHPDTGWDDYADGWDVLTPDGTVLKPDPSSPFTRLLLHPHETEQPFTRSQDGILISRDVTQVRVRAHDLVDGYGGREVTVDLAVGQGPGFEVERGP